MLDRRWRSRVEQGLGPAAKRLRRIGITADALTVFGLACSVATALLIASGHLVWAVVGVIVSGVADLLDGSIAWGSGQASPRGAFFDSVADRVSDAVLFMGVAWYLAGDSAYYPILAFAVAACSMMISYERARAESLGLDARGGLMERAERFVLLGVALAFNIIPAVLWIMLVLTAFTAVQRFVRVYRNAARPPQPQSEKASEPMTPVHPADRPATPLRTWLQTRRVEGRLVDGERASGPVIGQSDGAPDPDSQTSMGSRLTYYAYQAATRAAQLVPESAVPATGRVVGFLGGLPQRSARRMATRHQRRVTGRVDDRAVNGVFENYGRYWLEIFRLPIDVRHGVVAENFTITGYEQITDALADGKGAILALPHMGGWEWGAAWMTEQGHHMLAVVEALEPPELLEWFMRQREAMGLEIVPLGPDVSTVVLRALRDNRVVCLLCDRDLTGDGVEVEFFGEKTTLPAGPATLALRTGCAIFPVAVYFTPGRGHHAEVRPRLDTEREGRLRDDIARITQVLAGEFEQLIRAEPEQWHLLQANWPSDRE